MKILRKVYEGFGELDPEFRELDLGITEFIDIDSIPYIPNIEFFDPCVFSSPDKISEGKGVVHCTDFRQDCIKFGFDAESVTLLNNTYSITESMGKYRSNSPSLETPPVSPATFERISEPISDPVDYDLDLLMDDVFEIGATVSPEKDCFLPVCEEQEDEEGEKVGSSIDSKTDPQIFIPDNNNDLMKEPISTTGAPSELDDYIKNMIPDEFENDLNYNNNNNNFPNDIDLFAVVLSNSSALMNEEDQKTENNNDTTTTTTEITVAETNQESIVVQLKKDSDDTKPSAIISVTTATTTNDQISNSSFIKLDALELQPKVVLMRISQKEIDKALSSKNICDHQTINNNAKKGKLSTPTEPKRRGRPKKTPTSIITPTSTSINNNSSSRSSNNSKNKKRKREESESENNTDNSVQEIEYKNETPMVPTTRTNTRINPKSEPNRAFGMESEDKTGRVRRRRCFTVAPASSSSVLSVQEMVDKRFKSREAETPRSSLDTATRNGAHRYGLRNRNT